MDAELNDSAFSHNYLYQNGECKGKKMVNVGYKIVNMFTTGNMSFVIISISTCLINEGYVKSRIIQTIQFALELRLCFVKANSNTYEY